MLLKSDCPQCKNQLRVAEWTSGQAIGCPSCGVLFFPLPDEIEASKRGVSVGTPREKQSGTGRLRPRAPRTKGVKLTFGISVALASLLLVGGMTVAMVWFSRRVPDPDIMALVPSDSIEVSGMNMEEGSRDERSKRIQGLILGQKLGDRDKELLKHFGVEQDHLMRVVHSSGRKSSTRIYKLKRGRRFDPEKLGTLPNIDSVETIGERSYVKLKQDKINGVGVGMIRCYHLAAPRVLVESSEAGMYDILGRAPGDIDLGPNLKRLINRAGGSQIWEAFAIEDKPAGPNFGFGGLGSFGSKNKTTDGPLGFSTWMTISGEYLEVSEALLFDSRLIALETVAAAKASIEKMKTAIDDGGKNYQIPGINQQVAKAIKDAIDTITNKSIGPVYQTSIKLEWKEIESYVVERIVGKPNNGVMPGMTPPSPPPRQPPPGGVPPL